MAFEVDWSERESLMDTLINDGELEKLSPEAYEQLQRGMNMLRSAMTKAGIEGHFNTDGFCQAESFDHIAVGRELDAILNKKDELQNI